MAIDPTRQGWSILRKWALLATGILLWGCLWNLLDGAGVPAIISPCTLRQRTKKPLPETVSLLTPPPNGAKPRLPQEKRTQNRPWTVPHEYASAAYIIERPSPLVYKRRLYMDIRPNTTNNSTNLIETHVSPHSCGDLYTKKSTDCISRLKRDLYQIGSESGIQHHRLLWNSAGKPATTSTAAILGVHP